MKQHLTVLSPFVSIVSVQRGDRAPTTGFLTVAVRGGVAGKLAVAERDSSLGQIVGGEFQRDAVSGQNTDAVTP